MKFAISNALKDLSYYNTMAEDQHCQHYVAAGIKEALASLVDAGLGDSYLSTTAEQFGKLST